MTQVYHDLVVELKNCTTEKQLLNIVKYISENQKKLRLDESDMSRLEDIGTRRYEEIQRDRNFMIKNKKQGFNNYGD